MKQETVVEVEEQDLQKIKEDVQIINNKPLRRPFQVSMPRTANDMKVVYDVLSPDFISKEMEQYGGRDYVGAITYKIEEHDSIIENYNKSYGQTTLQDVEFTRNIRDYLSKYKLKLIDFDTETYRNRNPNNLNKYLKMEGLPSYFRDYLIALRKAKKNDLENIHTEFWRSMFVGSGGKRGTERITHFMAWGKASVESRQADKFMPQVPYIKNHDAKDELIKYTDDINRTAYDLYNDYSAYCGVLDMTVFRNANSIRQFSDSVSTAKQKFIMIKLLQTNMITSIGFGDYAKKNFEIFLKTLKDIKTVNPDKTIGLLAGGGFGYSILGSGAIDFFTDTVNNYPQEGFPIGSNRHRALLHPKTLTLEPIEGVLDHQAKNNGELFYKNSIAEKYIGVNVQNTDKQEWSMDCRRMGLLMWQQRMYGLLNTARMHMDRMRFDEVYNSDYANIGSIIENVCNM